MEILENWINNFKRVNGKSPSCDEIVAQIENIKIAIKPTNTLREGEDDLYRHVFGFVNNNLPNGTQLIGVSVFGGGFRLPNGSEIKFIPHTERNNEQNLRKSNTKYHILHYLRDVMSIESTDLLKENINKYVDKNY